MKKLIIAITAVLTLATAPAMAQVFLDEGTANANRPTGTSGPGAFIPEQGVDYDQYTPVGGGMLLLAGLAGAYLIGKRRKEE